jgi:sulfur-oxidizing protein SoxY
MLHEVVMTNDSVIVAETITRRAALAGAAAVVLVPRPACAVTEEEHAAAIEAIVGKTPVKPGRVKLTMPELAENGNSVGLTVVVESPMTEKDHVTAIHVVSEKNPIANMVKFHIGPRAGRAKISTNVRLATTQTVTVIAAMSDGSFWSGTAEVIVTLAACTEAG